MCWQESYLSGKVRAITISVPVLTSESSNSKVANGRLLPNISLNHAMASDIDVPLEIDAVSLLNNITFAIRLIKSFSCHLQILVPLSLISCHALPTNRRPLTRKFFVDVFNWLLPSLSQTPLRILNAAYPLGRSVFVV